MTKETNKLATTLRLKSKTVRTENGALAYSTEAIGNRWVEIFYGVTSFRNRNVIREESLKTRFKRFASKEDPLVKAFVDALEASKNFDDKRYGIRLALLVRDVINGAGERDLGRVLMTELADRNLVTAERLVDVLGNKGYGRFDDLVEIAAATKNASLAKAIRTGLILQLMADEAALKSGGKISLLAKWMPSISASSSKTRQDALSFIREMGVSKKDYRKLLSRLRAALDVVEKKICTKNYSEIDYAKLPSLASLRYANQFYTYDSERYRAYLDAVKKGEAKLNTKALSAPEVIAKARKENFPEACEVFWNALPKAEIAGNILPICDVSGSMYRSIGALLAIDVSVGLSIYLSEANSGAFKGLVMSFSEDPVITDISSLATLKEKAWKITSVGGFNTNIEKVLEVLFNFCKAKKIEASELPTLVIFSDMEFDSANIGNPYDTVFETYQGKFQELGLPFPRVIFWNIAGRTGGVPLIENKAGLVLCSGFSEKILKALLAGTYPTPWEILKDILDSPRYAGLLDGE